MSLRVLITGAGGASGIYSIKVLKESTDHYILGVDASPYSPGLFLADEGYVLPLARDEEKFLDSIKEIVLDKDIDVIIPNVDEELGLFSRPDVQATLGTKVIVSPLETIRVCSDKLKTIAALKDTVPCPETITADESLTEIVFPVHIKPVRGRGSRHTHIIQDEQALQECLRQLTDILEGRKNILVQEYLPGKEYTVDLLCDLAGSPVLIVPRVRVRTSGGLSVQGQTVRDERLIKSVRQIANVLKFYGPVNLQFREDVDGVPKLMEINPRFSGGLPIVTSAGANTPALLLAMVEGNFDNSQDYQSMWEEGVVLRYLEEFFVPQSEWNARFSK